MLTRKFGPPRVKFILLTVTFCLVAIIALASVGSTALATPGCKTVNGHLASEAADLDGNPTALETVGTL